MKYYQLYLDESGSFKEAHGRTPSIVAGYLTSRKLNQNWVTGLMEKVKHSKRDYKNININYFHGKDEKNQHLQEYVTDLICQLCANDIRLVEFKNRRNFNIIDSDVTYLNVFVQGIIQLIRYLLSETRDRITLEIIYAHRIYVEEKEKTDTLIRIEQEAYEQRIEERMILALARLPQMDQNRLNYTMRTDNAIKYLPLMLADAICFALRGGKSSFKFEQRERIFQQPKLLFSVLSDSSWNVIEEQLAQNRVADAIYDWYSRKRDMNLQSHRKEFFTLVTNKLREIGESAQEVQFQMLSQFIGALVEQRQFSIADSIMDELIERFYPALQELGLDISKNFFDIAFYRLTTATHQGQTEKSVQMIDFCENLRKGKPFILEDLNYYLTYELRVVEHLKNVFDFSGAAGKLSSIVAMLKDIMNIIPDVSGMNHINQPIYSTTLGKVLGSLTQTRTHMVKQDASLLDQARKDSNTAIMQFQRVRDKQRQFQNRAALECAAHNFEEAVTWLAKSVDVEFDGHFQSVLRAILDIKPIQIFSLSQYASIMAEGFRLHENKSEEMFKAWRDLVVEKRIKEEISDGLANYPGYLISWNVGRCYAAKQDIKTAKEYYNEAKKCALSSPLNYTIYSAGLAISAEELSLPGNLHMKGGIQRLSEMYHNFLKQDLPDSMKDVFEPWQEKLENLKSMSESKQQAVLTCFASHIPIL